MELQYQVDGSNFLAQFGSPFSKPFSDVALCLDGIVSGAGVRRVRIDSFWLCAQVEPMYCKTWKETVIDLFVVIVWSSLH